MPTIPTILYPLLNGMRFDHSSIEFGINGLPTIFAGISEVSYSHQLDGKEVRGNRPQAIGRTRGQYTCEANLTMPKAEYTVLQSILSTQGALLDQGYLEVSFDISINYGESGTYVTDVIQGCRLKKPATDSKEGGDAVMVKIDLHPMLIIENGLLPFQPSKILR